jgi:hypothetical protein
MSKILRGTRTGTVRKFASWAEGDGFVDGEVLARIRASVLGTAAPGGMGVLLRGSGADGSNRGYTFVLKGGADRAYIGRYSGSTSHVVLTTDATGDAIVTGAWYWIRARAIGSALKMRWWKDGDAEPGADQLSATNADNVEGWVGLWVSTDQTGNVELDWLSIAFGDDNPVAPGPS